MSQAEKPDDPGFDLVTPDLPIARPVRRPRPMARYVRGLLVLMALGFASVLGLALWLNPYTAEGAPRSMATHTQLGLPPCNMVSLIGKPCPACGMTTSFSLLMHGDPVNSARANWVGTLLAAFSLVMVPWGLASAYKGRTLGVRSAEAATTVGVIVLLVLMFGRWGVVLLQT